MSYISPIKIDYTAEPEEGWTDNIGKYLAGEIDNLVIESCVKVGCQVDKDELENTLKAMRTESAMPPPRGAGWRRSCRR